MLSLKKMKLPSAKKEVWREETETEAVELTDSFEFDEEGQIKEVPSIHQLVNQERAKVNLKPMKRSRQLDLMAQKVAARIAEKDDGTKGQIPMESLQRYFKSGWVGQNIEAGNTIQEMHHNSMKNGSNSRDMILNKKFKAFGVATATNGKSGNLYMVQVFRGKRDN